MATEKNFLPSLTHEDSFYRYLREVNRIPSLTEEEEFLLAKNYLEMHDLQAAHKLVKSHLKLVAKIALSFRSYGLPVVELVQEGNIGLMHAVKKYDPDLGYRLSTYAMWWIKAAIQEYILKSWSLVKIGTTAAQKKLFFSLGKIKNQIQKVHGRPLDSRDYVKIASDLGVTEEEVKNMNERLSGGDLSLNDDAYHDGEGGELIEYIPSEGPTHEVIIADKQELSQKRQLLQKAFSILGERELDIFKARKLTSPAKTLDELSSKFNISKERVRQIENRAFEKVQDYILQYYNPHDTGIKQIASK